MISAPARLEVEGDGGRSEGPTAFQTEQIAIHYIDEQLARARRSLQRTRTYCLVAAFLILGYTSFMTIAIRSRLLRPQAAAEIGAYYFSKFAAQNDSSPSERAREQPRESSASAPETPATKSAENLADPVPKAGPGVTSDAPAAGADVVAYVNGFISQYHGNVQELIHEAQHPRTVQQLTDALDQEIRQHLPSREQHGYPDASYISQLNERLATLTQLELQLDRLARNQDLTPYEKAVRRVIASTMGNARSGS